jgi:hypothetical protein
MMADCQVLKNLRMILPLAPQNKYRMYRAARGHLYVVPVAETEPPSDQQVEKVVDVLTVKLADGQALGNLGVTPLPTLQNTSKMHKTHECLRVVRAVQVARMKPTNHQELQEPANDQEVKKAVDAQAVKMVADQAIMNRRMSPFLPAWGISSLYRKI